MAFNNFSIVPSIRCNNFHLIPTSNLLMPAWLSAWACVCVCFFTIYLIPFDCSLVHKMKQLLKSNKNIHFNWMMCVCAHSISVSSQFALLRHAKEQHCASLFSVYSASNGLLLFLFFFELFFFVCGHATWRIRLRSDSISISISIS